MTIRRAAKESKISRDTLHRRLKCNIPRPFGHPTVFSAEEERSFAQHLLLLSEFYLPICVDDLKICVLNYLERTNRSVRQFRDNIPGRDWARMFLKRHHEISQRIAENVKIVRAAVDEDVLRNYVTNLEKSLEGIPPQNIYNFDETNLTDNPGKKKVLCKRGVKHPELIRNTSRVSTNLMLCGTAAGELLPPYVVCKSKKVCTTWEEGGPEGAKYDCSKSGWFDSVTFENLFFRILLPNVRRKEGVKAVVCDNLSSHVSETVIAACKQHKIKFLFLPPNSTQWTQPLDVAFFGPMKRK